MNFKCQTTFCFSFADKLPVATEIRSQAWILLDYCYSRNKFENLGICSLNWSSMNTAFKTNLLPIWPLLQKKSVQNECTAGRMITGVITNHHFSFTFIQLHLFLMYPLRYIFHILLIITFTWQDIVSFVFLTRTINRPQTQFLTSL